MKDCSSKESPVTPMVARKLFFIMGENVVTQTLGFLINYHTVQIQKKINLQNSRTSLVAFSLSKILAYPWYL
jgi:hypothetical protein